MVNLNVNLSIHQFADGKKIFKTDTVTFKSKNFIFAPNGSGKSTLAHCIDEEHSDKYNVKVFRGFEELVGENRTLNAFSLAVGAGDNEEEIRNKEKEISEKEKALQELKELIAPESGGYWNKKADAANEHRKKEKEIDEFFTKSAAEIKNLNNPQIAPPSYDKNKMKSEVDKVTVLQDTEVQLLESTVNSSGLRAAIPLKRIDWDCSEVLNSVNQILTTKVKETNIIERFNDDNRKREFAKQGLEVHNHNQGEVCAFCGNAIEQKVFTELETFFSADDIKKLENAIIAEIDRLSQMQNELDEISKGEGEFYPKFLTRSDEAFKQIEEGKRQITEFLAAVQTALQDKGKNLFSSTEALDLFVPAPLNIDLFNQVVEENNEYGKNLEKEKENAKDKLRYHKIKQKLDAFGYGVRQEQLKQAKEKADHAESEFKAIESKNEEITKQITQLQHEVEDLQPKAEKQAVKNINKKLKNSLLKWELDYVEDNGSYYRIKEIDENGQVTHRGVDCLSKGEKNIIAFLYFVEELAKVESGNNLPKIIIFDDPMTSNDAAMQYLMITELRKIYQDTDKFDHNKDYLLVMTHNSHFYLNVKPDKFEKANHYHLQAGTFNLIEKKNDDLKRHYETLWYELQEVFKQNHIHAALNLMRRIIETYTIFMKIDSDEFYQENDQYRKLFHVNSHQAIDDINTEAFSQRPDELYKIFRQIFIDNEAESHFDAYWPSKQTLVGAEQRKEHVVNGQQVFTNDKLTEIN